MYKIFLSCRNRLAITAKCITAIRKFSQLQHQIYVYDNLSNFKVDEHFMYWNLLYQKGIVHQITFNTKESTFNAFSKAVACNQFGYEHEMDPNKDKVDFLVFLDNDCIFVQQGWDSIIKEAWDDVKKHKMDNIKIIGQLPNGIISKTALSQKIAGFTAKTGQHGGSGFWCVKPNFFKEIGFLDIKNLIGLHKKHDQNYWPKLQGVTKGKDYILGLQTKLIIHTGSISGSICNTLTKNKLKQKNPDELIKFENQDDKINSMSFDEFYKSIINNQSMINDW